VISVVPAARGRGRAPVYDLTRWLWVPPGPGRRTTSASHDACHRDCPLACAGWHCTIALPHHSHCSAQHGCEIRDCRLPGLQAM